MAMTAPAIAGDGPFGALDFSRLSKPQEQFFWKRLKSLAFEEGAITYCGQPDGFAARAKQGIRSCVTEEALNKAESVFKSEMKATLDSFSERKTPCDAKPDVTRGWLGVDLAPAGKAAAEGAGAPIASGALVAGAFDDSPAAKADIRAGDVITALDGETIAGPRELSAKVRALAPGATVQLSLSRDGAARAVSVTLGAMAFDRQGRIAFDMPALIASSKDDLKYVSDEVTEMCRKCKTTIWAIFCR
jgi:hypothetical protein